MAIMSLSPLLLWAGPQEVPDWTQWQIGTGFTIWIWELDSGTCRLKLKAEQTQSPLDTGHWRSDLVLVIHQLYTEYDVYETEC